MPVGTVRGRFELDAPALRTLRDLEKQGIKTQAQMHALGEEMDRVGGQRDVAQIREYGSELGDLRRTSERVHREMRADWIESTRVMRLEVFRQRNEIRLLSADLDLLDRKRVTPQIDLDGVTQAIAQVELLQRRLTALGNRRVSPSVGGVGGGGGLPQRGRSSFGGGGGGRRGGMPRLGPLPGGPLGMAAVGFGLPAVQSLVGAGGALLGSAGAAAAGAGALGIAGAGGLAVGIGSSLLVGKPTITLIQTATKAQLAYNNAVADYGRKSTEAAMAKRNLNQAMDVAPRGTRQLLRDRAALGTRFRNLSAPGRNDLVRTMIGGIGFGNALAPAVAGAANRSLGAVNRESQALYGNDAFRGRLATGTRVGAGIFDENLGNVRQTGMYGIESALNVMQAARPFLHDATTFMRDWVRGWATSTRDIETTRRKIGGMVDQLRAWVHMAGAAWQLVRDLGHDAAPAGQGAVGAVTAQLQEWDRWVRGNPAQVDDFFRRTTRSAGKLAQAVGHIAGALNHLASELAPALDGLSQLVSLVGNAGLLTPGAGSLVLGAFRGGRSVFGRGGRGGGGGGRSGGGMILPAGGGGGGGAGRTVVPIFGGGIGAGLRGALGGGGYMRSTYGLARGFGYGRTAAAGAAGLGALQLGGGTLRTLGMAGLRGAGRAFAPVALTMAALDAASYSGDRHGLSSIPGRLQAAASGATLGLIAHPQTTAQLDDKSSGYANSYLGRLSQGRSLGGLRGDISRLRRGIRLAPGTDIDLGSGGARDRRLQDIRDALTQELRVRQGMVDDLRHQRRQAKDARSVTRADRYSAQFQEGYQRRAAKEGPQAAMADTVSGVLGQMRHMRRAGARELAQSTLDWAKQVRAKNPALTKEYDKLIAGIQQRFEGLHGRIVVVNGQILDGSRKQWKQIGDALASAARRGVDETSAEFDRLKAIAIGQLEAMGYNHNQAAHVFTAYRSIASGGKLRGAAALGAARGQQAAGQRYAAMGRQARTGDGPGGPRTDKGLLAQARQSTTSGLMGANMNLAPYDRIARRFGLHVTSGARPGAITASGNVSLHSSGHAIDESGSAAGMLRYARFMAQNYGGQLEELIHTPLGYGIKNGRRVPLSFWGPEINAEHYSHVHVGDVNPHGGRGGGMAAGIGGSVPQVHLGGRNSRLGGVPGMLSTAAGRGMAAGMQRALNAVLGAGGGGGGYSGHGAMTPRQVARLAESVGLPGWTFSEIAHGESGYNPRAIGHDPGGTLGLGLFQVTTGYNDDVIARFGGRRGMMNPRQNALAAKAIYDRAGIGAWYGTRYMTNPNRHFTGDGTGLGHAQPFRRRSRGVRSRPAMIGGGGGINVHVAMGHVTVREHADVDRIAQRVGDLVGEKLLAAVGGGTDPIDD